jgi:hypothetical protein
VLLPSSPVSVSVAASVGTAPFAVAGAAGGGLRAVGLGVSGGDRRVAGAGSVGVVVVVLAGRPVSGAMVGALGAGLGWRSRGCGCGGLSVRRARVVVSGWGRPVVGARGPVLGVWCAAVLAGARSPGVVPRCAAVGAGGCVCCVAGVAAGDASVGQQIWLSELGVHHLSQRLFLLFWQSCTSPFRLYLPKYGLQCFQNQIAV